MDAGKTSFVYVTYIRSTPEKVFEAITRPEIARTYWGHENVSDWQAGSRWQHVRANETRSVELVGDVVESTPPSRLVITWAAASQADNPKAYSRVTFEIVPYEDMVKLTVTHDELEPGSGMDTGIRVSHPFDPAWELPVYIANFILMDYGTGAIFGCPAHDQRDFDFATKYGLPIKAVFVAEGAEDAPLSEAFVPMKSERVHYVRGFAGSAVQTGEEAILADLLPRGVATQVFAALLENGASEQGARMSAMDNATRNAGDMINRLTIQYNRSRQAAITKELIEIISGAEAL